jgi:hypothetical protein
MKNLHAWTDLLRNINNFIKVWSILYRTYDIQYCSYSGWTSTLALLPTGLGVRSAVLGGGEGLGSLLASTASVFRTSLMCFEIPTSFSSNGWGIGDNGFSTFSLPALWGGAGECRVKISAPSSHFNFPLTPVGWWWGLLLLSRESQVPTNPPHGHFDERCTPPNRCPPLSAIGLV